MGRRQLCRRIGTVPVFTSFKPSGVPAVKTEELTLLVEEAEAVRLKDLEKLEQAECAGKMNISRPTFARILDSARGKIADAILNGKALKIRGGNYEMAQRRFRCLSGHEWDVPFESLVNEKPEECPECHTPSIMPLFPGGTGGGRFGRGGRGQGRR